MANDRQPEQPDKKQSIAQVARALARQNQELVQLLESLLPPPEPGFIPTALQQDVLDALKNKGLRTDALANKLGVSRSRLYKNPGGLPELIEEGLVSHHPRIGYYRPDAQPPELAT